MSKDTWIWNDLIIETVIRFALLFAFIFAVFFLLSKAKPSITQFGDDIRAAIAHTTNCQCTDEPDWPIGQERNESQQDQNSRENISLESKEKQ